MSSFERFAGGKRDGQIPAHCRFQVSLPTPLAPIAAFVAPEDQSRIEPLYEARIVHELETLFDAIPHDQLAVQWDTNFEFAMLDGVMPTWFPDPRSSIIERLVRLGRSIPADVALGYHFCHGHERHHRQRPYDAKVLVDIANALSLSLGRSLDWVHLPVQGGRVDVGFFETIAQLAPRPETRLYLGLLHPDDGLVGAQARLVAAQRFVHDFGVATDCGWSRHRPQDVPPAHRAAPGDVVADPPVARPSGVHLAGGLGRASPTRTGRGRPSTPSAPRTTTSLDTAGTATSIRPSRSCPTWWPMARSSSTTRAGRGSSSTA